MKKYKLKKVPIKDFADCYMVSDDGRVWSVRNGIWMKPHANWAGYLSVFLKKGKGHVRRVAIHRLVALAFLGEPPYPTWQVDHIDNDKTNNSLENLQWLSPIENTRKSFRQSQRHFVGNSVTDRRGHRSPCAKLSSGQAQEIKERLARGEKGRALALEYGVSPQNICNIKKGRTYYA